MNRIIYFIEMLVIQVPMIWRQTAYPYYVYRHYYAKNAKSNKRLLLLLGNADFEANVKRRYTFIGPAGGGGGGKVKGTTVNPADYKQK